MSLDDDAAPHVGSPDEKLSSVQLFDRSRELYQAGQVAAALPFALKALNGKRARQAHFDHAARLLYDMGFYRMAELVARDALARGLEKASVHGVLARSLHRLGELEEALVHFDTAVELAPDNEGLRRFRDKVKARVTIPASAPTVEQLTAE